MSADRPISDGHERPVLAEGQRVLGGRLQVEYLIARGAMAGVYLAKDLAANRAVALKVLEGKYARRSDAEPRLFAEARYAAELWRCRRVIHVLAHGHLPEADGAAYLLMEYVDGPTLMGYVRGHSPDMLTRCLLLLDVAVAMRAAHGAQIVHRDIKPMNVLVDRAGPRPIGMLGDFGLATQLDAPIGSGQRLTSLHDRPGTKHYMAPEQCASPDVGTPADVYAWGVTALEVFEGAAPMAERSAAEVVMRKCDKAQPSFALDRARAELPSDVVAIVDRALRLDPSARPTAVEICEVLGRLEAQGLATSRRGAAVREDASGVDVTALAPRAGSIELGPEALARTGGTELEIRVPVGLTQIVEVDAIEAAVRASVAAEPVVGDSRVGRTDRARLPWVVGLTLLGAAAIAVSWVVRGGSADERAALERGAAVAPSAAMATSAERVEPERASANATVAPRPAALAPTSAPSRSAERAVPPEPAAAAPRVETPRPAAPKPAPAGPPPKPVPVEPVVPAPDSPSCVELRGAAETSAQRFDWEGVLRVTKNRRCWTGAEAQLARLRVRAFTNLGRYRECVEAAADTEDKQARRNAEACRAQLETP